MIAETVIIATPDHGTLEFELAGLGSRFAAHVVDALLIGLGIAAIAVLLAVTGLGSALAIERAFRSDGEWGMSWSAALLILAAFAVLWGYYVFFECVMHGATPGKRQLGLRVLRDDGLPIGFREAALRNLVRAADAFPPPSYLLGGIVLFLDPHGRRLGDLVAGTIVVREKFEAGTTSSAGAAWASRVEQGHSRQAVTLPRGAVSPTQVDLVEQFLHRRFELSDERRLALGWKIAAPLLELAGEDRAAWEHRPDRGAQCEQFLLGLVDLAKAPRAAARSEPATVNPRILF